jgi:hypothetical protein
MLLGDVRNEAAAAGSWVPHHQQASLMAPSEAVERDVDLPFLARSRDPEVPRGSPTFEE